MAAKESQKERKGGVRKEKERIREGKGWCPGGRGKKRLMGVIKLKT